MSTKPFGFLQEDFHSEVLSFLLELVSDQYPNKELILYNNIDRYNNRKKYTNRYKNLTVRSLDKYIPDMANNVCEKIFIISYDNVFHLSLLLPYRDQLIFIAHSSKHIKAYTDHNLTYFSLTSLLSTSFMLPLTKDISSFSSNYIEPSSDVKNIESMQSIKDKNLEVLMIVGSFFKNNKDIDVLEEILETKRYIIVICSSELTEDLRDFVHKHHDYVYIALNLSTDDLIYTINFFNIRYLLFTPPKDSKFYTSSWSGSLQFAFDHNLHLIMPNIIGQIYNFKNHCTICYNTTDDIISSLDSGEVLKYSVNESYQKIRDNVFTRNKVVLQFILDKKKSSQLGHYKINFTEDVISQVNKYQELLDSSIKYHADAENPEQAENIVRNRKIKYMANKTIIQVGIDDTIFPLSLLLLESTSKIIQFVQDLNTAKYFKDIFLYNNLYKRITFYNAVLGSENKTRDTYETFCLDTLRYENVGIIYIKDTLFGNFVTGGIDTIQKYNPLIFVHKTIENEYTNTDNLLSSIGYTKRDIGNFIIYINE